MTQQDLVISVGNPRPIHHPCSCGGKMVWKAIVRCTVILGVLCSPSLTLASSCPTTTVNNLIGTSCSIGDVNFSFLNAGEDSFIGISASDITLVPDGSNPLAPSFTLTGPFTETANSSNSGFASQEFNFSWNLSVTNSLFQISSSTATIFDASLP